jgi:hypothetical protein
MYRTSPSLLKIIPFRAKQGTSALHRGPVCPVGAYLPGVLYCNFIPYKYRISPDQHNSCARETYERNLATFVNAIGLYTVHSDCMIGIDLFRLEI